MSTLKLNNYYRSQLEKIGNPHVGYAPQVKINSPENGQTNWMALNDESAQELVNWLNENYNVVLK
jgi:hypothetical protein